MKSMKKLIEDYITPFKTEYIILGALIILFSALKSFDENPFSIFLMGLTSFVIFLIFLYLLVDVFLINARSKTLTVLELVFCIFFFLFFFGFFLLIFTQFEKQFPVFLGIFLGFFSVAIWREIRWGFIILHRNLTPKFKIPFFIFNFIIIILFLILFHFLNQGLSNILEKTIENFNSVDIFIITFYIISLLIFISFIFIFLTDMFKKRITHYNIKIEETLSNEIYRKIKKKLNKQRETS